MSLADFAERLFWTVLVTFLTALTASGVLDVSIPAVKLAAIAALAAGIEVVVLFARQRLSVLPDPGGGLPGLLSEEE